MTQEQQAPRKRVRINVSTSVKGIKTWDATVEITADAMIQQHDGFIDNPLVEVTMAESDALVRELDKRYPAPEVG